MRKAVIAVVAAALATHAASPTALAQIAVIANDTKVRLVNGVVEVVRDPPADSVSILDLASTPPRLIGTVAAPTSVVGPPLSVAITPDERLALVTANQKIDPANAGRTIPDNRLTVIDLKATPPAAIATIETGAGPAGLSINRAGTLALVANRAAGTVTVLRIAGAAVTAIGEVRIADAASGVSHVAFTPDGRRALVTRDGDNRISVLAIDGEAVTLANRDIFAGLHPYGLAIAAGGQVAVVANIGVGAGDADTLSTIDLSREPFRVAETITVGQTPEGIMISPDGRLAAAVVMNGSNKPSGSPFHAARGKVVLLRIDGTRLVPVAEAPIGTWSQGAAFSADSRRLVVTNMVERNAQVFAVDNDGLREIATFETPGGGAAIRIANGG
jgi:DNA-binding beta-propeller fold protein YncE